MKLHIERSQEEQKSGCFSNKTETWFTLKVRLEVSSQELETLRKLKLDDVIISEYFINPAVPESRMKVWTSKLIRPEGCNLSFKLPGTLEKVEAEIIERCRLIKSKVEGFSNFGGSGTIEL